NLYETRAQRARPQARRNAPRTSTAKGLSTGSCIHDVHRAIIKNSCNVKLLYVMRQIIALSLRSARDFQLAYSIRQGRPFHPQPCRRAVGPPNDPIGFSNSAKHVFAFGLFESTQL